MTQARFFLMMILLMFGFWSVVLFFAYRQQVCFRVTAENEHASNTGPAYPGEGGPFRPRLLLVNRGFETVQGQSSLILFGAGGFSFIVGLLAAYLTGLNHRKDQTALLESERKLSSLIEAMPDSIQFKDGAGRWLFFNQCALDVFGLKGVDCAGFTDEELSRLVEPQFREALLNCKRSDEMVWREGRPSRIEERIPCSEEGELVYDVIKVPRFDRNGDRADLVIVGRDITEARRADAEVRRLSEAFIQCTETIILADTSQNIQYVNPAFERMFGYSLSEVKGQHLSLLLPDQGSLPVSERGDNSIVSNVDGSFEGEKLRRSKDGRIIPVLLKVAPVKDDRGKTVGLVGTMTDLTEIRMADRVLRESELRLRQSQRIASVGHYTFDIERRTFTCSDVVDDIFGIDVSYPRTLRGWLDLIHPADREEMSGAFFRAFRDRMAFDSEFRIVRRSDGEERWLHAVGQPESDGAGNLARIFGVVQDISESKKASKHLALTSFALDQVQQAAYMADEEGRLRYVNEAACRALGYSRSELLSMKVGDVDEVPVDWRTSWPTIKSLGTVSFEGSHRRKDGRTFPVEIHATFFEYEGVPYILGLVRDITDRKKSESALRLAASVFANAHEGICITDPEKRIIEVNSTFCELTGYDRNEVIGHTPRLLRSGQQSTDFYASMWQTIIAEGHWQGEVWNCRRNGELYASRLTISAVSNEKGDVTNYVGVLSDITAAKQYEAQLERIAHYDSLTGIPNRMLLGDRMAQAIARTSRDRSLMAVCYLDLDGFKPINDTYGHNAGDLLLVEVAKRIQASLRGGDTVARLGGDEFVILLQEIKILDECKNALHRILEAIARPLALADETVMVTASVGVTLYPRDAADPDTLLRHADQAMYLAKQEGRNRYRIFDV